MPMTLADLAVAWGFPEQKAILDSLVKESGILKTMPFQKASHGLSHKYKVRQDLPTGGWRTPGGSIVPHSSSTQILQEDLKILTDVQQEDKALCEGYPSGVAGYFADEMPAFMEGLGQTAGKQLIYGTDATFGSTGGFLGLRQYAALAGNVITGTGTSGSNTTILAVRWAPGVCTGLYNEAAFAQGQLIQVTTLNNGQPVLVVADTSTGALKPVYQALYEAYISLLVASSKCVAAYIKLQDDTGDRPTATNLDYLIDMVKGRADGSTFLYMNRGARRMIQQLKDGKYTAKAEDTTYNTMVERWNGIPIVLDENFSSVETI